MNPNEENPYASPAPFDPMSTHPSQYGSQGLYRDGKLVVATRDATFPDRCVKCNAPAEGFRLKRSLSWHHPLFYVIIFICNVIVYVIVAMIVRKTATYYVGLCETHRRKRRQAILIGWSCFLGGVSLAVWGFSKGDAILGLLAVVILFAGSLYGLIGSRVLYPKRIDKEYAWIKGACPEFLASLEQST